MKMADLNQPRLLILFLLEGFYHLEEWRDNTFHVTPSPSFQLASLPHCMNLLFSRISWTRWFSNNLSAPRCNPRHWLQIQSSIISQTTFDSGSHTVFHIIYGSLAFIETLDYLLITAQLRLIIRGVDPLS